MANRVSELVFRPTPSDTPRLLEFRSMTTWKWCGQHPPNDTVFNDPYWESFTPIFQSPRRIGRTRVLEDALRFTDAGIVFLGNIFGTMPNVERWPKFNFSFDQAVLDLASNIELVNILADWKDYFLTGRCEYRVVKPKKSCASRKRLIKMAAQADKQWQSMDDDLDSLWDE